MEQLSVTYLNGKLFALPTKNRPGQEGLQRTNTMMYLSVASMTKKVSNIIFWLKFIPVQFLSLKPNSIKNYGVI